MRSSNSGYSGGRFPFSAGATASVGSGRVFPKESSPGSYFGVNLNDHTEALYSSDFAQVNGAFSRAVTETVDRAKASISTQPTTLNYEQRKTIVEDAVLGTTTPIEGLSPDQRASYLALPEVKAAVHDMRDAVKRGEFRGIGQTGQFFAALGQLSGNQTFSALGTIAMASAHSFLALDALTATSGTLAQVGAASAVAFSAIQIGSALFGSKESNGFGAFAAAIFQGFAVLSKQIDQFRLETHKRFDRLEKILQISFSKMNERFDDLFLKLCVLDYLSNDLNFKTALIDSRLQSVAIQIQSGFDAVLAHLASDIRAIQNPNVSDYFKTMSSTEYNRLFQQCLTSINNASLPAYNGTYITAATALEKIDFLNQSGETGFSAHLAGILGYVFTKFKEHNPRLALSGPGTINPLQATFAVSAIDTLVQKTNFSFDRPWREHETKITTALSSFSSLKNAMTTLASSPDAFTKMIDEYRTKVQAVKTLIASIIQDETRKFYLEKGVHPSQVDSYPRLDRDLDAELRRFEGSDIGKRELSALNVELGDVSGLNYHSCWHDKSINGFLEAVGTAPESLHALLEKYPEISKIFNPVVRVLKGINALNLTAKHQPITDGVLTGSHEVAIIKIKQKKITLMADGQPFWEGTIKFSLDGNHWYFSTDSIALNLSWNFNDHYSLPRVIDTYRHYSHGGHQYNQMEETSGHGPVLSICKPQVSERLIDEAIVPLKASLQSMLDKARKKLGERLRGDSELNNLLNQMEILRLATLGAFRLIGVSDEQARLFFSYQGEPIILSYHSTIIPTRGATLSVTKVEFDSSIRQLIDNGRFMRPGDSLSDALDDTLSPNILIASANPADIRSLIAQVRPGTLRESSSILRNYIEPNIEILEELVGEIPRLERERLDYVRAQTAEAARRREEEARKVEEAATEAMRKQADVTSAVVTQVSKLLDGFSAQISTQISGLDSRFNSRFFSMEGRISDLSTKVSEIERRLLEKG